jgi:hypothetical protein
MCGVVRFEVTAPPVSAGWCHCTRCQRRTGTPASVSARLEPDSLRIVSGELSLREYMPADGYAKVFCGECGSGVWSRSPDGSVIAVRMGAFDGDPGVRPSFHQYVDYAASWAPIPDDGLPRFPERKTS